MIFLEEKKEWFEDSLLFLCNNISLMNDGRRY